MSQSEYPGAFFVPTRTGENEVQVTCRALREVLEKYPEQPIVYWVELCLYEQFPKNITGLRNFFQEKMRLTTIRAYQEVGQILANPHHCPWPLLEDVFKEATREVKELFTQIPNRLERLGRVGRKKAADILSDEESSREVHVEFELPNFDFAYFSLAASVGRELFMPDMDDGDTKSARASFRLYLSSRVLACKARDIELTKRIASSHFLDSDAVHFIPRSAFHALSLPACLRQSGVICTELEGDIEHLKRPSWKWMQAFAADPSFSETTEAERLLLASMLYEILALAKAPNEILESVVTLPLSSLQSWIEGFTPNSSPQPVFVRSVEWAQATCEH